MLPTVSSYFYFFCNFKYELFNNEKINLNKLTTLIVFSYFLNSS